MTCHMGHERCIIGRDLRVGDILGGFGTNGGARIVNLEPYRFPTHPEWDFRTAITAGGVLNAFTIDQAHCQEVV